MSGVPEEVARDALTRAAHKLPCKTKFVKRIDPISGMEVS
jgi:large subunit ribosomal protein L16